MPIRGPWFCHQYTVFDQLKQRMLKGKKSSEGKDGTSSPKALHAFFGFCLGCSLQVCGHLPHLPSYQVGWHLIFYLLSPQASKSPSFDNVLFMEKLQGGDPGCRVGRERAGGVSEEEPKDHLRGNRFHLEKRRLAGILQRAASPDSENRPELGSAAHGRGEDHKDDTGLSARPRRLPTHQSHQIEDQLIGIVLPHRCLVNGPAPADRGRNLEKIYVIPFVNLISQVSNREGCWHREMLGAAYSG